MGPLYNRSGDDYTAEMASTRDHNRTPVQADYDRKVIVEKALTQQPLLVLSRARAKSV